MLKFTTLALIFPNLYILLVLLITVALIPDILLWGFWLILWLVKKTATEQNVRVNRKYKNFTIFYVWINNALFAKQKWQKIFENHCLWKINIYGFVRLNVNRIGFFNDCPGTRSIKAVKRRSWPIIVWINSKNYKSSTIVLITSKFPASSKIKYWY